MADPVVISCESACTVTVVHDLSLPPLQLDSVDGALIASAILAIWAIGFGIRAVIQTIKSGGISNSESET